LDVGHGNCAIAQGDEDVFIIDCAPGAVLVDTLNKIGIKDVTHVLLSHADEDHIGGVITLLLEKRVHNVYLNPDAVKRTAIWQDMRSALAEARRSGQTVVHPSLTTNDNGKFGCRQLVLRILAPHPEDALGGVGGQDIEGHKQGHNTMSVVIKVIYGSRPVALLTGDLDQVGVEHLQREGEDLRAEVLVFPHHGGTPGGANPKEFAESLCNAVNPEIVVFSIGRAKKGFPRIEIVNGVKQSSPSSHIACTQLSKGCAAVEPESSFKHLNVLPARGKLTNSCCSGTIVIELIEGEDSYRAFIKGHSEFVSSEVPTPMCAESDTTAETISAADAT
jgi:beta-lactamase superfamily II metal-dependent hydrolase